MKPLGAGIAPTPFLQSIEDGYSQTDELDTNQIHHGLSLLIIETLVAYLFS